MDAQPILTLECSTYYRNVARGFVVTGVIMIGLGLVGLVGPPLLVLFLPFGPGFLIIGLLLYTRMPKRVIVWDDRIECTNFGRTRSLSTTTVRIERRDSSGYTLIDVSGSRISIPWRLSQAKKLCEMIENSPPYTPYCLNCGYDLRGSAEEKVCPECGAAIKL